MIKFLFGIAVGVFLGQVGFIERFALKAIAWVKTKIAKKRVG